MEDPEAVAVSLTRAEWSAVQEALDEYFYVLEHSQPGGVRRTTKERKAARREWLLTALPRIDVAIHDQAGVGPVFGNLGTQP